MKYFILPVILLLPALCMGKIGVGLNGGIIPNFYQASAKTTNTTNNVGGAVNARLLFGNDIVEGGVIVEGGAMGTLPGPYFAGGVLGNVVAPLPKIEIYGGGMLRFMTSGSSGNTAKGVEYGLQAGTRIKLVSLISLNLEAGLRYARLTETVESSIFPTGSMDYKQRIIGIPLMVGVHFNL